MSEAAVNYSSEVEGFLDSLFEGQDGYVYSPTKNSATGYWQPYFFKWPQQKTAIITHILDQTAHKDCYVAPSLFKAPSDKKQAWKGSNFVWIEFDGNAPDNLPDGIPNPSIRIQSSTKGHEHWYWRLDTFEKEYEVIEGLSKRLTYTLDADKSGWDASQVLRPPGTIHHDSGRRVRLLSANQQPKSIADFKNLVEPPESVVLDTNFTDVPDSATVVAKYKWDKEAWDLFQKTSQPTGSRSSAMTRLGFHCIEMGMSNEECYSILYNADERWGKFKHRPPADRAKRLVGIITHCRSKKELEVELNLSEREPAYLLGDFLDTQLNVKWIYSDFLSEQGFGIISSAPGIGKSTLSLRLGFHTALGRDFLFWKNAIKSGRRVGFFSLEMAGIEVKKFIKDMLPSFTPEEQEILRKQIVIFPLGYAMALDEKKNQQHIMDIIDQYELDFIIIDSLKAATGLDEKRTDKFMDWVNKDIRNERKATMWLIHHNRKPPNEGPRKPKDLSDLYGDTFITAHPTVVISLWRKAQGVLEVIPLKVRLAAETKAFTIVRKEHLDFEIKETLSLHEEDNEEGKGEPDGKSESIFGG